jgi:outer membrane immunogenic protein
MIKSFSMRMAAAVAVTTLMLTAPVAQAADLLPPPPPEMRTSVYDWSGAYIGAGFMGVGVDSNYVPVGNPDPNLDGDGPMGSLYAGYNYQMGSYVMGIEGDVSFGHVDPNNILDEVEQEIDFMASLRARIGWVHDSTMIYGTAGIAWADSEITLPAFGESDSKTHTGYIIGGGVEHAFTNHLVGRMEYMFADFNEKTYTYTPGQVITGLDEVHMVRVGGAWKF